jgi:ABC-2 type transport system ATP-binding protein
LHEVELVCEHVAIIKRGNVIVQGSVKELVKTGDVLQIKVGDPDKAMAILREQKWISSVNKEGDYILLGVKADKAADVSAVLARDDIFASEIKAKENSLEEFFLEQTEEEKTNV